MFTLPENCTVNELLGDLRIVSTSNLLGLLVGTLLIAGRDMQGWNYE